MISIESATMPEAVPDCFRNAELAFVPSVSAAIVMVEVFGVAVVLDEHPFIVNELDSKRIAEEAIVVNLFIFFIFK